MKKKTNHKIYLAVSILSAMIPALAAAEVIVSFPLDSDPGWSTQGDWEFGVPLGGGSHCNNPTSGHTGTNVYGYNLSGDYANNIPAYYLTTTVLDCSGYDNVALKFWRWLGVEYDSYDHATVEVSNDGSNWTLVWDHTGGSFCDGAWIECDYDISSVADNQSTVYIRWTMGPTDGSITYPGWNIDDISLLGDFMDDLHITPSEDFNSSGYEGGPFDPPSKTYTLTNSGVSALEWTASSTQNWLDIDPNGGTLNPGSPEAVIVSLNAIANTLDPCTYSDSVTFTNTTSGFVQMQNITLDVMPIPGEIEVTDSIPELNDLNMPFGGGIIGLARTAHITIANTDPTYELVVSDISLGGVHFEDFQEGLTEGSKEITNSKWEVIADEYLGEKAKYKTRLDGLEKINSGGEQPVIFEGHVLTPYDGPSLNESCGGRILYAPAEADTPTFRTELAAACGGATVDYFDTRADTPSAALLSTYSCIFTWVNGPYANNVQFGENLADYVDTGGTVILGQWCYPSGQSNSLAGRIITPAYCPVTVTTGYSSGSYAGDGTDCVHDSVSAYTTSFLDVATLLPGNLSDGTFAPDGSISVAWRADGQVYYSAGNTGLYYGGGDWAQLVCNMSCCYAAVPFQIEGIPSLPFTIPPLGEIVFDVDFMPTHEKLYESNVVIVSNDEDEPEVEVLLSGTGIIDYLEIFSEEAIEFCGHPGGPFVPCSDEYRYRLTNIHTTENIAWTAALAVPWLDIWPESGELEPGESIYIWLSINAVGEGLPEGQYPGPSAIVFTDLFTTLEQLRDVNLEVLTSPKIWVTPDSFDVTSIEGGTLTEALTISNTGEAILNFNVTTYEILEGSTENTTSSEPETGNEKVLPEYESGKPVVFNKTFTGGPGSRVTGDAPYKEGELIVRFAPRPDGKSASPVDKQQILTSLGRGTIKREFSLVPGLSVIELPAGMTVEDALQAFYETEGILYAQPNYKVHAISTFPDDTRFDDLWGMHNTGQTGGTVDADIDAPEAWDIATGSSEIIVAVIDTGVDYDHVDLAGNMWINTDEIPGNGQDDDGNGYVDDVYGYDFYNDDGDPYDDNGHGTHVSGTIGAIGNNNEGVAGVCWNVKIMALKFLSAGGSGNTDDAIGCVEYSVLMGANLSSNSWGGGGYSQALWDTIDAAGAAGMLFIAAAGNDGVDTDISPHYPSSYDCDSIVAVMSTDHYDDMSSFSNYGPISVDLGAPGSSILSCVPGDQYQYKNGTSMATPHVAGACALLWSVNPMLSSADLQNILIGTVDPTLTGLCVSEGRLNLFNAISQMQAPWIEIAPDSGSAAPGDLNDVNVTFNATVLEPGVYEAEIVVASNDPLSPTIVIPVTMTVRPNPLEVIPEDGFEFNGHTGGPFAPEYQSFTLTNKDPVPLGWTAAVDVDWLNLTPQSGTLDPNESIMVDLWINENADTLERNEAGYIATVTFTNTISGVSMHPVTLWVMEIDYFTELFESEDNDLDNQTLTFTRNSLGNFYDVCRQVADEFPVSPNGGTVLSLEDDDYEQVSLSAGVVSLYGEDFDSLFVGSNGYITFGIGDTQYVENLDNHFMFKRISGLFDDLSPNLGGQVSWKELPDRAVVTFENVPEYYVPGFQEGKINNFQIELFFSGTIRITYLDISATDGLAGLSRGENTPVYFEESDLSGYYLCGDFEPDGDVDMDDLMMLCERWLLGELSWDVSPDGGDGIVNFKDWAVFANGWGSTNEMEDLIEFMEQWLQVGITPAEISLFDIAPTQRDGIINILDYAVLAGNWLEGTVP